MIHELQAFLKVNYGEFEKRIGQIPRTCCSSSSVVAFSFDEITKHFQSEINAVNRLKSMDALLIFPEKSELCFVEMTSFVNYSNSKCKGTNRDCLDFIIKELRGRDLRDKVVHSIFTIIKIIDYFNLNKNLYTHLLDSKRTKINHYLVLDITDEQYIYIAFSCMDKLERNRKNRIEGEINILSCDAFQAKMANS
jgi:hypothetical protein